MKKLLLLLILGTAFVACDEKNPDGSFKLDAGVNSPYLLPIDSCQYIVWGKGLAHRGTCKHCKELREQEIKKAIKEALEELKNNGEWEQ